jgi:hypothetical protein
MRFLCAGAVCAVLVLTTAAILAACAPPLDNRGTGNLRIILAGGTGARALSPQTIAGLSYRLDFSGPGGRTQSRTLEAGTQAVTLNLDLGDWTIRAQAYQGETLFGEGTVVVTVEAGRTSEVTILMKTVSSDITAFSFDSLTPPAIGIVDHAAKTVTVTVPPGTDVRSLTPTIEVSPGVAIEPAADAAQDFTNPVAYIVTATDGSFTLWTVTVLGPLTSIAEVVAYLASTTGGASTTDPVFLPVALTLADAGNGWTALLDVINAANKYAALDLSFCTMAATEFDPGTANTGESRIASLVLPIAAESIKADATFGSNPTFQYFTSLTSITGANIEDIGGRAFFGCTALGSVNFPTVKTIGDSAFSGCTGLAQVSLPAGLTDLGDRAFSLCTGLKTVNLPASLTNTGVNPFIGCTSLTNIVVDPGSTAYSVQDGMLLDKAGTTLIAYPSATGTITLPGITTIGEQAFSLCTGLTTVNLPDAATIGENAFSGCTGLTSVDLPVAVNIGSVAFGSTGTTALTLTLTLGPVAPVLGANMFNGINAAKTVTVKIPSGATGYGFSPTDTVTANWGNGFRGDGWNGSMTDGTVNSSIALPIAPEYFTSIAEVSPYLAAASGSATAPVFLRVALDLASDWNGLLAAINTANKPVALDLSACTMTGGGVASTEYDPGTANTGESRIVSLVLPNAAESIKADATYGSSPTFQYFTSLKRVAGANITDIGEYVFSDCAGLMIVNLPKADNIGEAAFYNCYDLETVDLSTVTIIGASIFGNCTGLRTVDLSSVLIVSDSTFSGCTALETVDLSSAQTVDNYAFRACESLVMVDLSAATSIGNTVFDRCTALTTVNLPAVTSMGYQVFISTGGQALDITLGTTVPTLGTYTFYSSVITSKSVTIRAPSGAITDYGSASYDDTDTATNNWGNAFRGLGWDGTGVVNANVSLTFKTY